MENRKGLILLNGDPSLASFFEELQLEGERESFFIIAVDGGVKELKGLNLLPDLLLGDMDSISKGEGEALLLAGVPKESYPIKKDKTDGQLALEKIISLGIKEVTFFGALGGRIDQTLANIQLLDRGLEKGLSMRIVSQREILYGGEGQLTFMATPKTPFSLLPLSTKVLGLSIQGSYYDIKGGSLLLGDTLGLSNRVLAPPVKIRSEEGRFLLVVERRSSPKE